MSFSALFATPISEVIPKTQKLYTIDSKTSLLNALQELSSRNIYSAPVKDHSNGNYYGFLDLIDIVVYIVGSIEDKKLQYQGHDKHKSKTLSDWISSLGIENAKNLADLSLNNPMVPLRPHDTIAEALKVFATTGTHRVPVLGNENVAEIVNVLTQIDVLVWLNNHMKEVHSDIRKKTLQELQVPQKTVYSVTTGAKVFEAFKMMIDKKITAVALVNQDGSLLSSLSAKDIKEIKPDELLTWMNRTTLEFVQKIRMKQINVTVPAFACHLHHTLDEVVVKLNVLRVHRLYITDEAGMPIGVLSLGDLFKIITAS